MEKSVATLDQGTTCSSWNYCRQRMAAGSNDGMLSIFDSVDPASSSFTPSIKFKAHKSGILKVIWFPPEYGDAVACISADGTLSLWEEVVEDSGSLQWRLCKNFEKSSNEVIDVQFGVSATSLKMLRWVYCNNSARRKKAVMAIGE